LDHKKLELFKIKKINGPINYKLILLKIINIYPIFYISLFKQAPPGVLFTSIIKIKPINPNTEYKIEDILNHKKIRGYIKYLIK
jgi:hypothetical protein